MILLKDGVKYLPHDYADEKELEDMVIDHCTDIFGQNSLYFDPQTMKTETGIEAKNDGLVLAIDQNKWYIVEVELAKHSLHKHIIPQITEFSMSYEEESTKKKIVKTLHNAIQQDPSKKAIIQLQKIEDLHETLTDMIDMQPIIAILIDQEKVELDQICKKLPFVTQTTAFKTYARENVGIGVHIHEFEPFHKEEIKMPILKNQKVIMEEGEGGPRKLVQVLEVAKLVFKGQELSTAFKSVAKQHGVNESTVRDKCTRQLKIDTKQFGELIQSKNSLITFLKGKYPLYSNLIETRLE